MAVRHTVRGALALSMLLAISIAPAFCADRFEDHLKSKLLQAYKKGDYVGAQTYGAKLLARKPDDFDARYYLANAYVMTHQNEAAISQYRFCLHNSKNESLKAYAAIALERLLKQKEQSLATLSKTGTAAKNKEMRDFENKITAESYNEQKRLQREWDQALAALNNRQMSQNSYRHGGGFGFGNGFGGYGDSAQRERNQINQTYQRRMNDLAQYKEAMLTQTNCGIGKIRLAPNLSTSRVKNYVNYGDQSEAAYIPVDNPLHAQALPLDPNPTQNKSTAKAEAKAKNIAKVAHSPAKTPR